MRTDCFPQIDRSCEPICDDASAQSLARPRQLPTTQAFRARAPMFGLSVLARLPTTERRAWRWRAVFVCAYVIPVVRSRPGDVAPVPYNRLVCGGTQES